MLDTVKINHVQHISFTQSRLTDAVSVILSELLSYEHPSKSPGLFALYAAWSIFCPSLTSSIVPSVSVRRRVMFLLSRSCTTSSCGWP